MAENTGLSSRLWHAYIQKPCREGGSGGLAVIHRADIGLNMKTVLADRLQPWSKLSLLG